MTSLTRWLSRLQLSPRSQRVLTEALLDWRHEVATTESVGGVILAHWRGAVAVASVGGPCVAESALPAFHLSWIWSLMISSAFVSFIVATRPDAMLMLFACVAVPLAILFGPARRRSPFFGLAMIQVLVSVSVCVLFPSLSRSLMLQGALAAVVASATADRIRMDIHRVRLTAQLGLLLGVVWYVALQLAVGMRIAGVAELITEHALWAWLTTCLVGFLCWIVREQQRWPWWAYPSSRVVYQAEVSK